ncbi:MAG TPA: glutamate--cysteine ligase [Burkholderiales bacterium]|nr:glutamate--cysteine ligase [Burkholderiales bacterium]
MLAPAVLKGIRRGIEKESLRVRPDGNLAMTPHPAGLGSALTNDHITTDFSESQLELITGVHSDIESCLRELTQIHQFVYRSLGEEIMWCASMPCALPADDAIPIGQYGSSNVGRMKTVYRTGLSNRYGRRMQMISGIHYNFSLPDTVWPMKGLGLGESGEPNDAYFSLIRNFRRNAWLLFYLFGASPAVCSSFVAGRQHELTSLAGGTYHLPGATSLRMGRLGYQSDAQAAIAASYNSIEQYGASLFEALTRPYPPYEKIGIRDGDDYRQLDTSLLQIENEFYGKIRAKRVIRPGERPLHALRERGVEYVEVRLMDLNPFCAIGIDAPTIRLLDVFLLHCLLADSPPDTPEEIAAMGRNQNRVAARGREAGLQLERQGRQVGLRDWGRQVLDECAPIAQALDAAHGGSAYADGLTAALGLLDNPDATPSAHVLDAIRKDHGNSYIDFALKHSLRHAAQIKELALAPEVQNRFEIMAGHSLEEQRRIEASDTMPFEIYRQQYLAPERLNAAPIRRRA